MQFEPFEIIRTLGRTPPTGVIQVGAHNAHEVEAYFRYGIQSAILIDPLDNCINAIRQLVADAPTYIPVKAICSAVPG